MICKNCGKDVPSGNSFCPNCGSPCNTPSAPNNTSPKLRCLPSFILGLIGSIFGLMGGICTTMCAMGGGNSAFFFIFVGSLIGLVGACLCLNKAKLGSILETVAALMIIYRAYFDGGSEFMSVIALLLLLAGGIIGLIYSFIIKRK